MLPNRGLSCLGAFVASVAISGCTDDVETLVPRSEYATTNAQLEETQDPLVKASKLKSKSDGKGQKA